jgi:hypothetical protein
MPEYTPRSVCCHMLTLSAHTMMYRGQCTRTDSPHFAPNYLFSYTSTDARTSPLSGGTRGAGACIHHALGNTHAYLMPLWTAHQPVHSSGRYPLPFHEIHRRPASRAVPARRASQAARPARRRRITSRGHLRAARATGERIQRVRPRPAQSATAKAASVARRRQIEGKNVAGWAHGSPGRECDGNRRRDHHSGAGTGCSVNAADDDGGAGGEDGDVIGPRYTGEGGPQREGDGGGAKLEPRNGALGYSCLDYCRIAVHMIGATGRRGNICNTVGIGCCSTDLKE